MIPKQVPATTQANREEQAGPSKVIQDKFIDRHARKPREHMKTWDARLRRRWLEVTGEELDLPLNLKECQRLHHELLQADDEAFEKNIPQEVGPSKVEQQDAQEQDTIPKEPIQEDIIFKECSVGRDPERPHRNRSLMSKWVGKIPHPDDNPTYTFIQPIDKSEEYKKLPYMSQLIGLIHPKIKEVLQTELHDTSELTKVEKYHRGDMRAILLEEDIEEHITKTIGEIDVQIEGILKKESHYILELILEIYIETYTLRRALRESYIPTPKKLANIKSTINPDNQGLINPETNRPSERCLQGALDAYFAHQDKHTDHLERIFQAKKYKLYLDIVKLDGIPMPTPICSRIFDKIEKMNPDISISVWGWNEESATPKSCNS
ncbi:hypothetical protein RclHR1_40090001 [Rhizophagus clarus]|uniref:Uncharacterized protein n=1 Tax=Rhizophagus clarus TaxID=94130 RepID=A0A2Z6RIJ7_9GLOM|nr:hypothetical protein RclHR1_40090001 [Rhizophagus clarus]